MTFGKSSLLLSILSIVSFVGWHKRDDFLFVFDEICWLMDVFPKNDETEDWNSLLLVFDDLDFFDFLIVDVSIFFVYWGAYNELDSL